MTSHVMSVRHVRQSLHIYLNLFTKTSVCLWMYFQSTYIHHCMSIFKNAWNDSFCCLHLPHLNIITKKSVGENLYFQSTFKYQCMWILTNAWNYAFLLHALISVAENLSFLSTFIHQCMRNIPNSWILNLNP
jgi:hypothetical protein